MKNSSLLTTNKKVQDIYRLILFIFFLSINIAGGIYLFLIFTQITVQTITSTNTIQSKLITAPNIVLYNQIIQERKVRNLYTPSSTPKRYSLPSVFSN